GTVRADGGTEIRVETPSPLRPGRGAHLLNKGTMRIEPGAWFDLRATAWNTFLGVAEIFGTARVNEGAEWTNRGWTIVGEDAAVLTLGGRRTPGVFANFGRIELRAGALVANGGAFENRENGVLGGIGVFDNGRGGVFLSEGILKPGLPAGDLAFLGDLPLSAESEVDVVIGGTEPGAFSRLLVTGEVAFAGALHVSLANGFEPALGDAFQVIAGSGPGAGRAFDCAGGLNLPGGLYLDPVEEGGTLSLVTIEDAGVNLPPLAADDAESTGVDQPIVLSVLSNDEDPDLDPLRILSLSVGGLAGFVAIDPGDTTVTYVPPAGFSGVESFRYVASDCRGGSDSALVTVRVASPPRAWRVPGDAATIQSGLDLAAPGDTVLVACGVYHENGIAMKPGVVLRGENSGGEPCATIDAGALGRALLVSGAGPGTVVRGLRFVNGLAPSGGAVLCVNGSTPLFENCAFTGNRAGTTGGGLSSDAASAPAFRKCTFAGNRAARGGGIYFGGGSLDVERTIVWGNCGDTDGAEIFLDDGASATFVLSDIDTSEIDGLGTYMWGAGSLSVDPMFCSPVACGDAPASAGNHRIDLRSPCFALLPEGSIGAFGPGCLGRLVFTSEEEARAYALVRTGVEEAADPSPLARRFDVLPNPARGSVTILYARPAGAPGALRVYDVAGRLVRSFPIGAPSGAVEWDGTNDAGARVAPGVYFLRLLSGSEVETRRLTLVR
ncbi:MAG: cadherin-like domain-containing protein, partial [Candidatus Eisenbacteria bacterium]|nr:cadherin-like domain-containing protein [Candidatus Eisenbacteria bacterium]